MTTLKRNATAACPRAHALYKDLAFAYSALPWLVFPLISTKPLMLRDFFACEHAFVHGAIFEYAFRPAAVCLFDTILPLLFLCNMDFVSPDVVFSFEPRKTTDLAMIPLAMMDLRLEAEVRIAFIGIAIFSLGTEALVENVCAAAECSATSWL